MERRNTRKPIELRADGEARRIAGHAAVYYDGSAGTEFALWENTVERIMPGAFDRAAREDDVRALFNHDPNQLLGRTTAKTLRLAVDSVGLAYEVDLPNTTLGRDLPELLKRGDVTGSSFGFIVRGETWRKEAGKQVREITDVQLFDVSPVTYPAYEGTDVGMRSAGGLDEARKSYELHQRREAAKARIDALK
jgi:uncharacterized protein